MWIFHVFNQLAPTLKDRGVQRGDRVTTLADKSPASSSSIFDILKAATDVVPLDPWVPALHLNFILLRDRRICLLAGADQVGPLARVSRGSPTLDEMTLTG